MGTLAGGVSIGATANFAMGPAGAMFIGIVAGALSTAGFSRPLIPSSIDTCGINSLHGMPGIFGGDPNTYFCISCSSCIASGNYSGHWSLCHFGCGHYDRWCNRSLAQTLADSRALL